jgi:hypothetical protein
MFFSLCAALNQLCNSLGAHEVETIVRDIRGQVLARNDQSLQQFFKDIEAKYSIHPSLHGEPEAIFSKALRDAHFTAKSKLSASEKDDLLHLGVPRASVHYWDAVSAAIKEDDSTVCTNTGAGKVLLSGVYVDYLISLVITVN